MIDQWGVEIAFRPVAGELNSNGAAIGSRESFPVGDVYRYANTYMYGCFVLRVPGRKCTLHCTVLLRTADYCRRTGCHYYSTTVPPCGAGAGELHVAHTLRRILLLGRLYQYQCGSWTTLRMVDFIWMAWSRPCWLVGWPMVMEDGVEGMVAVACKGKGHRRQGYPLVLVGKRKGLSGTSGAIRGTEIHHRCSTSPSWSGWKQWSRRPSSPEWVSHIPLFAASILHFTPPVHRHCRNE